MYRLSLEGQIKALQGDNIEGYSRRRPDHKQRLGGGGKQPGPLVNLEVAWPENGREWLSRWGSEYGGPGEPREGAWTCYEAEGSRQRGAMCSDLRF